MRRLLVELEDLGDDDAHGGDLVVEGEDLHTYAEHHFLWCFLNLIKHKIVPK